jgi:hypothetical protein
MAELRVGNGKTGVQSGLLHDREYKERDVDVETGVYLKRKVNVESPLRCYQLPAVLVASVVHHGNPGRLWTRSYRCRTRQMLDSYTPPVPSRAPDECIGLFTSTHNEDQPCGDWLVTGGIQLPFLPTKWNATLSPNPSNSRRVRVALYSSRIAFTGFRSIARRAGK